MASEPRFGLTTADGRRPRVAIIDGNAMNAMVTMTLARQFGCAPVVAANGEAALSLLRQDGGIDLVILDMGLSDVEGGVLVQLIRTLGERGAMPILALAEDGRIGARAAGFSGTVVKPFSPRELYGAMQAALGKLPAALSHDA